MTGCDLLDYGKVVARGSKKGLPCERLNYLYGESMQENTKLRELVRTIYMCSNIRCNHCEYGHGDTCSFDAESELRKLGVEVD